MQVVIHDFTIQETSVVCPSCYTPFATPLLAEMPPLTAKTMVEADLHRVLPDAAIRGALIAICPACIYTWWSTAFGGHFLVPGVLVPSPEIEYPKKFAHAVLTGRKNEAHPLDRALLALNGCWCAREVYANLSDKADEAKLENEKWLALAAQELEEALEDQSWNGNRSRYSYMMGEVLRQLGDFHKAVKYFDIVDRKSMLPYELVKHQRDMAVNGQSHAVLLPPHLVEAIFIPKPVIMPEEPVENFAVPPQAIADTSVSAI